MLKPGWLYHSYSKQRLSHKTVKPERYEGNYPVRCAIEGFCTQCLAKEYQTAKGQNTIQKLGEILKHQKEALALDDNYESFINYDHEFHLLLVNYIENEEINHMFQKLMYLIRLTTQSALEVEGRINGTIDEHSEYFENLKTGNGNEAYRILIDHLMMPLNIVRTEL